SRSAWRWAACEKYARTVGKSMTNASMTTIASAAERIVRTRGHDERGRSAGAGGVRAERASRPAGRDDAGRPPSFRWARGLAPPARTGLTGVTGRRADMPPSSPADGVKTVSDSRQPGAGRLPSPSPHGPGDAGGRLPDGNRPPDELSR